MSCCSLAKVAFSLPAGLPNAFKVALSISFNSASALASVLLPSIFSH